MRAVLTTSLATAALALSPSAFAASGTLDQLAPSVDGVTKVLAALGTLALLFVLKTRPQRIVKLDAKGRRYDPTVRGLFED